MTRFVAPVGPGWVIKDPRGPAHLLASFDRFGRRVPVLCGSIRRRRNRMMVWPWTHRPPDPCRDCDRALQIQRIRWILGRLP